MNEEDALSVCTEEIRCMGDQKQLIDSSEFYEGGNKGFLCRVNACSSNPQSIINDPCIYNGGDFTVEGYRKRGINKELTDFALQSIRGKITGRPRCLNMVYGLVKANAGNEPGGNGDRSNLIIQSFLPFARLLSDKSTENDCANYYRYRSHKPTFDPDSVVCRPEPSTKIDQDYGCLLQFKYRS